MPQPPQQSVFFRLYASEISYFSGKVRPAFRYKRVPCVEILPTPEVQRDIIRARTGLGLIPTVVTPDDETWQDSSDILDRLEALYPDPPLYPRSPVQRLFGYLVELYVDEFLMVPGVHYRWSYPESAAKARADFVAMTGDPSVLRFADQVAMFTRLAGALPETIPAWEAHAEALFALLEEHLTSQPYLLGGRPSLADCALMGPLYAHFYLDAVPGRILREHALRVCHWIERMNHPDPDSFSNWAAGDGLPGRMPALLSLLGADAIPFVLDHARAIESWADTAPADAGFLPRAVGTHATTLRGVHFERITTPYTLWMVQRVLAAYEALDDRGRAAVDAGLSGTGCEQLFSYRARHRVERRPFRLVLAR